VLGINAMLVMVEQIGKRADVPGAADHFAEVAMCDEALLETFEEFELDVLECSPNFLRIPVRIRFPLMLFRTYMVNRAVNLAGVNTDSKVATGGLSSRIGGL